jgi:DNA-binding CsgD family transcriptional regulator
MHVQTIAPGQLRHRGGPAPAFSRLIADLGGDRFSDSLFSEVRALCGCAHLVVMTSEGSRPIKVLVAANEGRTTQARETAEKYLAGYWRHDPVGAVLERAGPGDFAARTTPRDIGPGRYRRDCYGATGLIERFSILRSHGDRATRIYLYRSRQDGPFAPQSLDRVTSHADVLFSLVAKHDEVAMLRPRSGASVYEQLRRLAPGMPAREADVCAGIVSGRTSEAIAMGLGISVNTVLTYRKRAYARLGISSLNELLRLVG